MLINELEVNRLREWAAIEASRRTWDQSHFLQLALDGYARVYLGDGVLIAEKKMCLHDWREVDWGRIC